MEPEIKPCYNEFQEILPGGDVMKDEHEVTKRQDLLSRGGTVSEPGWARSLVWKYDRSAVRALPIRIKEWDYYLVRCRKGAFAVTISDLGYLGMLSASFIDLENVTEHTETVTELLPRGKYGLGTDSSDVSAEARTSRVHIRYSQDKGRRRIQCFWHDFEGGYDLKADLVLSQPPMDTMAIATPWKDHPKCFYYNQKIMNMPVQGSVILGKKKLEFSPDTDFGILDWGRGVWTYDNVWYWGTGSALVEGKPLGMNLGYGFSDRSCASENIFIYEGRAEKLGEAAIDIPKTADGKDFDYLGKWNISSKDGKLSAVFTPLLDRKARTDVLVIVSDQHQVFGVLNGSLKMDSGKVLQLNDYPCAIERVHNRY